MLLGFWGGGAFAADLKPASTRPVGGGAAVVDLTAVDRSGVSEAAIGMSQEAAIVPDAEPKPAHPPVGRPIVMTGATEEFFEKDAAILCSGADVMMAAVCHELKDALTIERFDLAGGRSLNTLHFSIPKLSGLDLSVDGKRLMTYARKDGFGNSDEVQVWSAE